MKLQTFIDLLESQNISYIVTDKMLRTWNYDKMDYEWTPSGDMEICVQGVNKHFVNFWFEISSYSPDCIQFRQRYNCNTGTALRSWGTGYNFFKKLEQNKIKQVN